MRKIVLLSFALLAIRSYSQTPIVWGVDENKHVPIGLKVGDKAPLFNAKNTQGQQVSLKELTQQGKVVILFYRGQWCPVCNRYLANLQDSVQYILDKGASVIAITPETVTNAKSMIDKTGINFSVIADENGAIMKNYDVLFHVSENYQEKIVKKLKTSIAENNGANEAMLPVPATYIIGTNGRIEKVFFDYNYKVRATPKQILDAL